MRLEENFLPPTPKKQLFYYAWKKSPLQSTSTPAKPVRAQDPTEEPFSLGAVHFKFSTTDAGLKKVQSTCESGHFIDRTVGPPTGRQACERDPRS